MRLDKWLWSARLFKTRGLAAEAVDRGRVLVNGHPAKPGRDLRRGDVLALRQEGWTREVEVLGLSPTRGPAPMAALLLRDTPTSLAAQQAWKEQRRLAPEPALGLTQGRPTKRDRRDLDRQTGQAPAWDRWSARWDDI
ncbi:MAG: RNA-binding S4 domain-containing protein [Aquabacterium sp.]